MSHHHLGVAASILIAILSSYAAVEFAGRVRAAADSAAKWVWIIAGSVSMGSGIWAMHFVGMSAATYPFAAAFEPGMTAASWLVGVGGSALAYFVCGMPRMTNARIVLTAVIVGSAMAAMHFVGMQALVVSPMTAYSLPWVAGAIAVAWVGAGAALALFRSLHGLRGAARLKRQMAAALALGASYAGMHYLAMAGTDFAAGAVCRSANGLRADQLGASVGVASMTMLVLMLLLIELQKRVESRADASDRSLERARQELHAFSLRDGVTQLPNRLVFQDRLKQSVERCARSGRMLAVMFVDLDEFNLRDQTWHGNDAEALLRGVAGTLRTSARDTDTVASIGGDQFLIIMDDLVDAEPVLRVAEQITQALSTPFMLENEPVRLSASIGIAVYPADGAAASMVGLAGRAAASARSDGGGRYRFFEPRMNVDVQERAEWLESLGLAIQRSEFELHYQPKFYASNGAIAGAEALLRWRHPTRGLVSPAVFIPLAEKFGLIGALGSWVVEDACRQMRAWHEAGIDVRVAINVSAQQLRLPSFSDEIADCLRRHRVDPALLTCELTETAAMEDIAVSLPVLQRLEAAGVQVSIDDFGTGYSSLSYLRKLPIRQLKIDRSFVNDLCDSDDARAVVASIIGLAHTLRLEVVAEGVETACQRDILAGLACDKFQGFLFARPMPAAALEALIAERRAPSDGPQQRASLMLAD